MAVDGELAELWLGRVCEPPWSSRTAAAELTAEKLAHICDRFWLLQKHLRVKMVLGLLYLPAERLKALRADATRLLQLAASDEQCKWVRIAAGLAQRWTRVADSPAGDGPGERELAAAVRATVATVAEGSDAPRASSLAGSCPTRTQPGLVWPDKRKRDLDSSFVPRECPYLVHSLLPKYLTRTMPEGERTSHFTLRQGHGLLAPLEAEKPFTRRMTAAPSGYVSGMGRAGRTATAGRRDRLKGGRSKVFGKRDAKGGRRRGLNRGGSGGTKSGKGNKAKMLDITDLQARDKQREEAEAEQQKEKAERDEARKAARKKKAEADKAARAKKKEERKAERAAAIKGIKTKRLLWPGRQRAEGGRSKGNSSLSQCGSIRYGLADEGWAPQD